MATEVITAPKLAELVKPVRALLTKTKKIHAIKLVRKTTGWGLKKSLEFVQHVQACPGARAQKVAALWIRSKRNESTIDAPEPELQQLVPPNGESTTARESADAKGMSLAESYAKYMETHTYSDWEQLVEKCIAAKEAEQQAIAKESK